MNVVGVFLTIHTQLSNKVDEPPCKWNLPKQRKLRNEQDSFCLFYFDKHVLEIL